MIKTISYYDILTMIKEGNKPPIIKYKDCSGTHIYKFDTKEGYYISKGHHHYIVFSMELMKMFEKNIEIIKPKKIEKLGDGDDFSLATQLDIIDKINEIIEVINEEKEIQNNKE